VDISNCWEIEQHGGVYKNFDGQAEDIMKILTGNGINYARLRLWVDPGRHPEHYPGDGNNHIGVTREIAVRAKAAGMKFLLNYHYSDYWADPGKQQIPYIWKDLPTKQDLYNAVYEYTKETILELIKAGAAPDMVQIGNEIRAGLLKHFAGGSAGGTGVVLDGWEDYSRALNAGSKAVREAAPGAKIMIQFDEGGNPAILEIFAGFTKCIDQPKHVPPYTEFDYDVIGLSWYPLWPSHRSIDSLYNNIRNLKSRFGKEVVVCESGYMFNVVDADYPPSKNGVVLPPGYDESELRNGYREEQENSSALSMTNENGFTADSGVLFGERPDGTVYLPATVENQARVYRAFMDAVAAAGGNGVMWWGADWYAPVWGLCSTVENGALFDNDGKALPAMRVLGGIKGRTP